MKKITLSIFTMFLCLILFAQTNTTGVENLSAGLSYTAEINITSTEVTLNLVGPSGGYLGIGFGVNSMTPGGDVLIYEGVANQISDRTFIGIGATPTLDATQEWSATTTDNGTTVTIQATRPLTSATGGYAFGITDTSIMLVWSHRPGNYSLGYHGGATRGATSFSFFTLSTEEFLTPTKFSIFPNPGNDIMNINIPSLTNEGLQLDVFDVLGKKIFSEPLSDLNTKIDISKWNSGLYLVRIASPNQNIKLSKRFVKL